MAHESKIKLVVAADEPALFYSAVARAEMDLEAIDVRDGVYPIAYGPDGRVFKLETIGEQVHIAEVEGQAPKPYELRALLIRYLSATGVHDLGKAESLDSLLARCEAAVD